MRIFIEKKYKILDPNTFQFTISTILPSQNQFKENNTKNPLQRNTLTQSDTFRKVDSYFFNALFPPFRSNLENLQETFCATQKMHFSSLQTNLKG